MLSPLLLTHVQHKQAHSTRRTSDATGTKQHDTSQEVLDFGASHVVGGAYHTARASMFAVQDRVAGAVDGNVIAELDPITGAERAQ